METIENTLLIRVDGVLYPVECENNINPKEQHVRELKQTLRVLEADAWPALAKGIISEHADQVVDLMIQYRTEYLAHAELDERVEYDSAERVLLEERLREQEYKRDNAHYLLRVMLVGEERVRERDLEIEQATLDFEDLGDLDEDGFEIPYVIWE